MLSGAFYGVVRFKPEWNPLLNRGFGGPRVVAMQSVSASEYLALRDSIDALDLSIRTETDPRRLKALKDQQEYFWKKLSTTRQQLASTPASNTDSEDQEVGGLIQTLTRVLIGTAVVLLMAILGLMLLLRHRKAEVTRKLEALKSDDRFKSPRGGFQEGADPTLVRPRRRSDGGLDPTYPGMAAGLPNVQPRESSPTAAQPTLPDQTVLATQTANLRPTARQRVTNAIKGLAEALAALKTPGNTPPSERLTRARVRVTSQNSTRYDFPDPHPLEATRFDREREEKGDIVKLARRGYTSSEIARRLRVPQDQVETVIRLQRESGE